MTASLLLLLSLTLGGHGVHEDSRLPPAIGHAQYNQAGLWYPIVQLPASHGRAKDAGAKIGAPPVAKIIGAATFTGSGQRSR